MLLKSLSVFICICTFTFQLSAQEKVPVKFGHIVADDFDISKTTADTTDGAVIIADIGYSSFQDNFYGITFKRQTRIKIINKNGFSLANVTIPLYKNGDAEETLEGLKASTYNLENGKVVETKLGKDAIFEDDFNSNHIIKKFTLPEVKEGSIIEYSYTIDSRFLYNLQPWKFQGRYLCLWSEYKVDIPEYLSYVTIAQGYKPFDIKTESDGATFSDESKPVRTVSKRWVIKNVPAFKEEKFTSSIENYITKIEFQMAGTNFPGQPYRDVLGSWTKLSEELLKREDFGDGLDRNNGWLNDTIKNTTASAVGDLDKVHKIYDYVKNNIRSTDFKNVLLGKSLKDVFKEKNGSVADINLLLIAMLRHENIKAVPVILSTVDNGYTNPLYPQIDKFNYVVCKVSIDSTILFLDASQSYLGFGRLPTYCYNGLARVINSTASAESFSPDTLNEHKITNVTLSADTTDIGTWTGNVALFMNYAESNIIREQIADKGKDVFEKKLRSSYSEDPSISKIEIANLNDCETTLKITHTIKVEGNNAGDVIYFNPILQNDYKENPLKALERQYPVEMPYPIDDSYRLNVDIPVGYEMDELPKSVKVTFNDNDGLFEYYVYKGQTSITLEFHLKFSKATFTSEDYGDLRSFFDYVVKKCDEQFVFKKKK